MENPLQHLWSRKPDIHLPLVMLKTSGNRINYEKLEVQSSAFATLLKEAGCTRGDRLCFMTRNKETALLIMSGIMKVGCIGIPINPRSTSQQIHSVMVSSDSNWLFTDESVSFYPDPLLIDTGEISLGWLGDSRKIPENISPEFTSENISQYAKGLGLADQKEDRAAFMFILPDGKGQMEKMSLPVSCIELFVNQVNVVSGRLKSERIAAFIPDSGCRLFRELFGTANRHGHFHLLSVKWLEDPSSLLSLLSDRKISQLFVDAGDAVELTERAEKLTMVSNGVKEVVIWGDQPTQKSLADLKALFPMCEVVNRSAGNVQDKQKHKKREKKSVISTVAFPHKSLEHWEKLFFGLTEDSIFSRLKHTDYVRDIKTSYLNYWRKVEEKNMLAIHQPIKISFHNDI